MHLRKYMHPRNKYKDEPDFKKLAVLYPEFRKVAVTELSGKVRLNFKDDESLRILTKILLKNDFGLEVEIPEKKLIPTMSLRLNYILWIEDMLNHSGLNDMKLAHGLDIGTGAVCIYPLLFAKLYQCKMTASEIDQQSIESANENIKRNNLQDFIKVISVPRETLLTRLVDDGTTYNFVMCNPPFYETDNELRKQKRLPPRNAPTGNESELIVKGGEISFITKIIEDSMIFKERVQIYTSMIGSKKSLIALKLELKNRNIENATWTEFCQGYTKRWGLAWSFLSTDVLDLTTAPTIRMKRENSDKKKNDRSSYDIVFPIHAKFKCVEDVVEALQSCIEDLSMDLKKLDLKGEKQPFWACKLTAYEDSWSQARKRRRKFLQPEDSERNEIKAISTDSIILPQNSEGSSQFLSGEPFLKLILVVDLVETEDESQQQNSTRIRISMMFDKGTGGRNSLETFRQFLVNKLNVREYFQNQFKNKKRKR